MIKVGGSLAANAANLRALCSELGKAGQRLKLIIVPGGGEFADVVRTVDARFVLGSRVTHRMAILGMDQYGLLLSTLIPECRTALSLGTVPALSGSGHVVVLLPSRLVLRARSLDASWEVTSDSIAAYVAGRLKTSKLVLVTNVDGVFTSDPKTDSNATLLKEMSASGMIEMSSRTSVDKSLPHMLLKYGLECFVVNGLFPERATKVLAGEEAICTHISAK